MLALLLGFSGQSVGATLIPILDEATEGGRNNGLPLNGYWAESQRYQQIWDSGLFGTETLRIDSLSFRLDGNYGSSFDLAAFPGSMVYLSTSQYSSKSLTEFFDLNHGADKTLVDSNFSVSGTTGPGSTNPFNVTLLFDTPFIYDPTVGSLLLEMVLPFLPVTSQFDAVSAGDAITAEFSRTAPTTGTSRLYAVNSSSPYGRVTSQYGLVAAFDATPFDSSSIAVPLPAGIVLLGSATGLLAFAGARRRRTPSPRGKEASYRNFAGFRAPETNQAAQRISAPPVIAVNR